MQISISNLLAAAAAAAALGASLPATAQELSHTFINPSFGGNPFNSDHLVAIANLDRPAAPKDPEDPASTPEELLISQLQAQLNATVSSNIFRDIQSAQPGQTRTYTIGQTTVTFVRTATETRVTFTNAETGETKEIVIPVTPTGTSVAPTGLSQLSAEGILAATGSSAFSNNPAASSGESGLLLAPPPL